MPELIGVPPQGVVERLTTDWKPATEFEKLSKLYERQNKLLLGTVTFWLTFDYERDMESAKRELEQHRFSVNKVEFEAINTIQLRASISLGDDLIQSRDEFLRAEGIVSGVARKFRGRNQQFLID
jgi:hypothetical protein